MLGRGVRIIAGHGACAWQMGRMAPSAGAKVAIHPPLHNGARLTEANQKNVSLRKHGGENLYEHVALNNPIMRAVETGKLPANLKKSPS